MCSEELMFAGLRNNAGQSRLPGAGSGHSMFPTIAYVLTSPRRLGQSGTQPLCEYEHTHTLTYGNQSHD